ncbi:alpha/beta hydrolase [Frankia sp. Ag45/Mut15]|uniref:Alpha/beta hydrolase n=1 Tax=Frankia umida TaxID=573489 RepID=A0ABT0K0G0_9ACTN|nr:alpha/beta fold hydrolase [Frankia umida]MCK9877279.1 alpha/beta hydrolase [Frankia umida]
MAGSVDVADSVVRAADGTPLGCRSLGAGPGLVVVHGAMQDGGSQADLAGLLAAGHRVHLVDRRGRGASGPYPRAAGTAVEVDDLRAVLAATGARCVLGVSSGAIIAARTALAHPGMIDRLALFEPPLSVDASMRLDLAPRLDAAVAAGDLATMMGLSLKIAQMGPPWLFGLPVGVLAALSRPMLRSAPRRAQAAALAVDFAVVRDNADRLAEFAAISGSVLLVDCAATRPYLRTAVAGLAAVIPGARRVTLAGHRHGVTQNRDERGRPDVIAPALLDFFG